MSPDTAHAVLTVDLAAIVANWRVLRAKHGTGETGAVVKGDGYGLGARPVVAALAAVGCETFFVATPDEALVLRDTIPNRRLIVLGGLLIGAADEYAAKGLIPALGSLAEIDAWSRLARRLDRALPAFVHFDTGMSRLGLDARELSVLSDDHGRLDGIAVQYVMSHLVSSEVPDDPLNVIQRDRFVAGMRRLPVAPACLENSSGIFLDQSFRFDLARPGAALYGVNPTPGRDNPMRPSASLSARILSVREIPAGASVGYSATWTATRPTRIATVGVGYADGWHRSHSNTGAAIFDGEQVPLVGRVSMDLTTYDVTDHPDAQPGGWLELLGPHRTVDDAARDAGTIGYEILTSLGSRYHRIYSPA
jgi:alanine racemase